MIKVFIADDHQMVREGVKRIVNEDPDMNICGEVDNGNELVDCLPTAKPDLLLLDVSMPGPGFLETLRRVTRAQPTLKILILSAHAEEQYARRAFKAGAKGYLTKNHSPEELIIAIKRLINGGKYISQSLAEILAFDIGEESNAPAHQSLSQREYQILCLLGSGLTVTTIAEDLSLSPKTISTYRTRLLEKMNLKNTNELIHYVVENDLSEKKII